MNIFPAYIGGRCQEDELFFLWWGNFVGLFSMHSDSWPPRVSMAHCLMYLDTFSSSLSPAAHTGSIIRNYILHFDYRSSILHYYTISIVAQYTWPFRFPHILIYMASSSKSYYQFRLINTLLTSSTSDGHYLGSRGDNNVQILELTLPHVLNIIVRLTVIDLNLNFWDFYNTHRHEQVSGYCSNSVHPYICMQKAARNSI